MDKIEFLVDNEMVEFFVLEETKINGVNYILVTEEEEGDSEALILKDLSLAEDSEAIYEIVEDDNELQAVAKIFAEMLEDIEFE